MIARTEFGIGATSPASGRKTISSRLADLWRSTVAVITTVALFLPPMISAQVLQWKYSGLLGISFAVVSWVLVSLIHELGHALAAWSIGWDVHVISVMRQSYLPARRWFGDVPLRSTNRLSGYVLATPQRLEDWSTWRRVVFILGGIVANLATAALLLIAVPVFASPSSAGAVLSGGFGLVSLFIAIVNLLPVYRDGGTSSDGAQLFDFALGRRMSTFKAAASRIFGLTIDRVPAKNWPSSLLAAVEGAADCPERLAILLSYYLAAGDTVKALAAMRQIEKANAAEARRYRALHAFLVALVERDAQAARAILSDEEPHDYGYWRAPFVILAVEGKRDEARAAVGEARRAALQTSLASPDADDEALMTAIENGQDLPTSFGAAA